jgi:glutamate 5-kinase
MAFTAAPRNLAQGAHVVVCTSGAYAAANAQVAALVDTYELLMTQAKQIVGEYLWVNKIVPLL